MSDAVTLIKSNPLTPPQDFAGLRKKGIDLIQELGHDIWTEYNPSDPGITILEAVCYGITDLGYRSSFDIKDLIAPEQLDKDTWKQIFYTARKILHNSPLTLTDYRKLLIDIDGVRNAWIQPSKNYEVPVWVDYNYSRLDDHKDCHCDDHDITECKGQLDVQVPSPKRVLDEKKAFSEELKALGDKKQERLTELADGPEHQEEIARIKKEMLQLLALKGKIDSEIAAIDNGQFKFYDPKIVEFEGLYNVLIEYEEDVSANDERKNKIRDIVEEKLMSHRNLCEDFLTIDTVDYADFGIGASISLEEYADPDEVLARIFFTIYKYFTPSVPFSTIANMLDKGYQVDEIFEGPALHHGFIETSELEKTDLFRDIRLSDIINEVADIKGIKAITYLHLPFFDFNSADSGLNYFYKWINQLRQERKVARIQPELSKIIFCKQREVITFYTGNETDRRPNRMLKLFRDLKTLERKYKLNLEPADLDFVVPAGENMELEEYYPVTYSLPGCYEVGENYDLPPDTEMKKKMQVLQLKGYFLFFEQLLSDHLVQLNHLRDLFSFDRDIHHTYFTRALSEIRHFKYLIIDRHGVSANDIDHLKADFAKQLQELAESTSNFFDRRNRFLNHLLARFGESLTEYEEISRWLTPANVDERMIRDKIKILRNDEYIRISSERAKAFDYTESHTWDTKNVSGGERRVGRLLGFRNIRRRSLAAEFLQIEEYDDSKGEHHRHMHHRHHKDIIKLVDPHNQDTVFLTSKPIKHGCCADTLITAILEHADDRKFFVFKNERKSNRHDSDEGRGHYSFELFDGTDPDEASLLAFSRTFKSKEDRDKAFEDLQDLLQKVNDSSEGMHLVEHLLLRPRLDIVLDEKDNPVDVRLFNICLDTCDLGIGLGQGTELPPYRKKVYRIPKKKCFDEKPWVLEYLRWDETNKKYRESVLFQEVYKDTKPPLPLKFRKYELLSARVLDLKEFGCERANYALVSNEEDDPAKVKWGFIIYGQNKKVLAKSLYIFNKRTDNQIANNIAVANDIEEEIGRLLRYFGSELDLYCQSDPCDNNEDPYSFRTTIVLPCWPKRFRNPTFRNLVEQTIKAELPAHIYKRIVWVGYLEMMRFENAYHEWLDELVNSKIARYPIVNKLVKVLDTLAPCGCCEDHCDDDDDYHITRKEKWL